jgi:hypothetical protein
LEQAEPPAELCPLGQLAHEVKGDELSWFAGQLVHAVSPVDDWYCPAAQDLHDTPAAMGSSLNLPAAQATQFVPSRCLPLVHCSQLEPVWSGEEQRHVPAEAVHVPGEHDATLQHLESTHLSLAQSPLAEHVPPSTVRAVHVISPAAEPEPSEQAEQPDDPTATFEPSQVYPVHPQVFTPQYVRAVVRALSVGSVTRLVYGAVTVSPAALAWEQQGSPSSSPLVLPSPSVSALQKSAVHDLDAVTNAVPKLLRPPPPPGVV